MARGVNEIERIIVSVLGPVREGDRLAFDRDPPFPLNIHVIQDLILKIPFLHHARILDQTVRQGRFSVVNMGNNAEVADVFHFCHL